jgi:hypothetical protein
VRARLVRGLFEGKFGFSVLFRDCIIALDNNQSQGIVTEMEQETVS